MEVPIGALVEDGNDSVVFVHSDTHPLVFTMRHVKVTTVSTARPMFSACPRRKIAIWRPDKTPSRSVPTEPSAAKASACSLPGALELKTALENKLAEVEKNLGNMPSSGGTLSFKRRTCSRVSTPFATRKRCPGSDVPPVVELFNLVCYNAYRNPNPTTTRRANGDSRSLGGIVADDRQFQPAGGAYQGHQHSRRMSAVGIANAESFINAAGDAGPVVLGPVGQMVRPECS